MPGIPSSARVDIRKAGSYRYFGAGRGCGLVQDVGEPQDFLSVSHHGGDR